MDRILVIVPSRERPEQCEKMLKSLHNNAKNQVESLLLLDTDDPKLEEYLDFVVKHASIYEILKREPVTDIINNAFNKYKGKYQYYHLTNDDVEYKTVYWDSIFIQKLEENGGGIAFGYDCFQEGNLPTFPFITAAIPEALGWIQEPTLERYFGDTVWGAIGWHESCLFKCQNVTIEHFTPLRAMSKQQIDETLKKNVIFQSDRKSYLEWYTKDSKKDFVTVRKALNRPTFHAGQPELNIIERMKAKLNQEGI